jgi:outer membrane protein TolC
MKHASLILASISLLGVTGCSMAPTYHVPTTPQAQTFKAEPGWQVATPADDVAKGQWWKLFHDPVLDGLVEKVAITNQNVVYYRAAWEQARALVQQNRASLFPSISSSASTTRSGSFAGGTGGNVTSGATTAVRVSSSYSAAVSGTWTPDLWGQVGNTVKQSKAQAQASEANLANATLSAQGDLATNYMSLRGSTRRSRCSMTRSRATRALTITKNKYASGTVSNADVYTAQTTLNNAQANRRDLDRQRATYENAIAVLIGENPSSFKLAPAPWAPTVPEVPSALPGDILQRLPTIASAERGGRGQCQHRHPEGRLLPDHHADGSGPDQRHGIVQPVHRRLLAVVDGASAALTLLDFGARAAKVKRRAPPMTRPSPPIARRC